MARPIALAVLVTLSACGPAPTLTSADATFEVPENAAAGTAVGTVTATASAGTAVTFAITQQAPGQPLSIDAASGALSVLEAAAFDFETNPVITATVTATSGELTATATVTVNVKNELREAADGAIVHFPLDGNAENALADQYDGTTAATPVADRTGAANRALAFVGTGVSPTSASFGNVPVTGGAYTVAFWIRIDAAAAAAARLASAGFRVLSMRAECRQGDFFDLQYSNLETSPHRFGAEIRADTNGLGSSPSVSYDGVPVDQWFHYTLVVDSAARKSSVYVDGALVKENTTWSAGPLPVALAGPLKVGGSPCINGNTVLGFEGSLDDLILFGRALTAAEVASLASP